MNNYGMPSTYDRWKTATPPEYDLECCDDCTPESMSDCCGAALLGEDSDYICGECKEHCDAAEGCGDEDCNCHCEDDGDAGFDAMRDDKLTEDK